MLGHRPNWYWKIMLAGVSPLLIITLIVLFLVNYIRGGTPTYQAWNKELVSWGSFLLLTEVLYFLLPSSVSRPVHMCDIPLPRHFLSAIA